ncbi:hypothetical protein Acor_77000 [Acrocarpospora corrugata]|uniref:Uncharacterized protein n=1 Tax=Acrocarpospora corrugata TaxID=35763 RepID=A0A5M3WC47_9ACTN|nr:hypothetical protein Acor_77000 [Acrocarpospora corrugata]
MRAELSDLAQAKASKAMQIVYAVEQLRRVWQLRAALKAPDRSRFFRSHRLACWVLKSEVRTWGLVSWQLL